MSLSTECVAALLSFRYPCTMVIHRWRKRWLLYILLQYLANQIKPTGHIQRYGLTAVVPILTALLLSRLNDLQFFFVFLCALLEFSCPKHYGFPYGGLKFVSFNFDIRLNCTPLSLITIIMQKSSPQKSFPKTAAAENMAFKVSVSILLRSPDIVRLLIKT